MSQDRSFALLVFGALTAGCAGAFWPGVHSEITTRALKEITAVWKPSSSVDAVLKGRSFAELAIKEIADANVAVDQFDCAGEKRTSLFSLTWDSPVSPNADLPATPCGGLQGIYDAHEDATFPLDHFDNELIEKSNDQLKNARKAVVAYIKQRRYAAARKMMGAALHALQDFYSHSNYVELGNSEIDTRLGKSTFTQGKPRLAKPREQVCFNGHDLLPKCSAPWDPSRPRSIVCTDDLGLSTGFYPSDNKSVCDGPCVKCAHGDYFVDPVVVMSNGRLPIKGINKDSLTAAPSWELHRFAYLLAYDHTQIFVKEILEESDLQANPQLLLGFMGNLSDERTCSCPQPVTRHTHNPNVIDINSTRYNDTGLVVKKGEVLTIVTAGVISWGQAGTLFGADLLTGPQGDRSLRATPAGHLLWIDPQMKGYPIGGVIGVIFPDDSAEPHRYPNTGGIFAGLPTDSQGRILPAISKFWVGEGGKLPPMEASGLLFLTVNDGNLGNNKGCFQAQIRR